MAKSEFPSRFYSLDVLRGVAALSVVFWHWQSFFLPFNKQGVAFFVEQQPMFDYFYIFYENGYEAILLFFCLSGFIFFWLYSKPIANKSLSPGTFAVLRLSRLYPLHFLTLLFVSVGQFFYMKMTKTYFVYTFNDTYDFSLNLFFASAWGFEKGHSFNAPVWSVSIEILLYAVFFVFSRWINLTFKSVFITIFVGHLLHRFDVIYDLEDFIALGIRNFFIGGLIFMAYERLIKEGDTWKVSLWLPLVTSVAWLATLVIMNPHYNFEFDRLPPMIAHKIVSAWPSFALFPMTILSLALIETKRGAFGKRLSFLGDISYATYLLHFPLQLAIAMVMVPLAINWKLFYSPLSMAIFFILLVIWSLVSHQYFEVPMQNFLRRKLLNRQKAASVQEPVQESHSLYLDPPRPTGMG